MAAAVREEVFAQSIGMSGSSLCDAHIKLKADM